MRLNKPLFALLLLVFVVFVPSLAHAKLKIAGKPRAETPERQGVYVGFSVAPGAALVRQGFVPTTRIAYSVGGGISDRFTLGASIGGTIYMGLKTGSFDADLVAHRFFGKGFFLRSGVGVVSRAPSRAPVVMRPGIGGRVGLGYEFRLFERMGLGVGLDYDVRVRTDGRVSQAAFLGLRFAGYLKKKR